MPIDRLILYYSAFTGLLALAWGHGWGSHLWHLVLAGHGILLCVLVWARFVPVRRPSWRGLARDLYPLGAILFLYWEIEPLGLLFSDGYHDPRVIRWEHAIFRGQPSLTLVQRLSWAPLSEYLHFAYGFYWLLPAVIFIALYRPGREAAFHDAIFTSLLIFFACYIVFIFWPVEGPLYRFGPLAAEPGWFCRRLVDAVLKAGDSRGTAFPSSHAAVAVGLLVVFWRHRLRLAWVLLPIVAGLVLGTVYGRYHYAVDAVVGTTVGVVLAPLAPRLYGWLDRRSAAPEREPAQGPRLRPTAVRSGSG